MNSAPSPLVSVVIPVYKNTGDLALLFECLSRQTLSSNEFEVIISDNEGSEDVRRLCKRFAARYVHEKQRSSYAARNAAIQLANASIIAMTDSDCMPASDWLEAGLKSMERKSDSIIAGNVVLTVSDHPSPVELYEKLTALNQKKIVSQRGYAITANIFCHASVFERVGMFNQNLRSGGDMEWGRRLKEYNISIEYDASVVVYHPTRKTLEDLKVRTSRIIQGLRSINQVMNGKISERISFLFFYSTLNLSNAATILANKDIRPRQKFSALKVWLTLQFHSVHQMISLKISNQIEKKD